jgi:hypothetical protein
MIKKIIKSNLLKISFGLILFFIFYLNLYLSLNKKNIYYNTSKNYFLSEKYLKSLSLCYDELFADFFWIKTLGYFGSESVFDKDYKYFSNLINFTIALDPYFQYPYEFGGIILSTEIGDIDESIKILKSGMDNVSQNHERYWYFPFFLAFNYMYYKQDYKTAANYLEQAAKFPQSPPYLPLLASRLYAKANSPENAIPFLKEMINNTDNEKLKNLLTERLKDIINEKNILFLEKAVAKYHEKFNKYPYDIIELKKSGIINQIPEEPFGGNYYYSIYDNSVISSTKPERLKLYINPKK